MTDFLSFLHTTPYVPNEDRTTDMLGWRHDRQTILQPLFPFWTVLTRRREYAEMLLLWLSALSDPKIRQVLPDTATPAQIYWSLELLYGVAALQGRQTQPETADDSDQTLSILNINRIRAFRDSTTRFAFDPAATPSAYENLTYGVATHYMSVLRHLHLVTDARRGEIPRPTPEARALLDTLEFSHQTLLLRWFSSKPPIGVTQDDLTKIANAWWQPVLAWRASLSDNGLTGASARTCRSDTRQKAINLRLRRRSVWIDVVRSQTNGVFPTFFETLLAVDAAGSYTSEEAAVNALRAKAFASDNPAVREAVEVCRAMEIMFGLGDRLLETMMNNASAIGPLRIDDFTKTHDAMLKPVSDAFVRAVRRLEKSGHGRVAQDLLSGTVSEPTDVPALLTALIRRHQRLKGADALINITNGLVTLTPNAQAHDLSSQGFLPDAPAVCKEAIDCRRMPDAYPQDGRTDTPERYWLKAVEPDSFWITFVRWFDLVRPNPSGESAHD